MSIARVRTFDPFPLTFLQDEAVNKIQGRNLYIPQLIVFAPILLLEQVEGGR